MDTDRFAMSILEAAAEDLLVVLNAVGSTIATVLGSTAGAKQAILFAATHPARCAKLILQDAGAKVTIADDYPYGLDDRASDAILDEARAGWGTGMTAQLAPSLFHDRRMRRWFARNQRLSISRSEICAALGALHRGGRARRLPLVQAETLVVSHDGDPLRPVGQGRYLADHIPHARYVELDGHDTWFFADTRVEDEIVRFVSTASPRGHRSDRVLATVLVTDLVASTATAVELGDLQSRDLLDTHDSVASRIVSRHQGRVVSHTGDGLVATFDLPGRAVFCAFELASELATVGLEARAGIHAGEIELRGDDVGGIAVHLAARIMATAGAGEVLAVADGQGPDRRLRARLRAPRKPPAQGHPRRLGAAPLRPTAVVELSVGPGVERRDPVEPARSSGTAGRASTPIGAKLAGC